MKLTKRTLALILCFVLVLVTMTACGKDDEKPATNPDTQTEDPKDPEPTPTEPEKLEGEITFWHFNNNEGPALAKAFEEANPGVKVNVVITADTDLAYQNKIASAARAGSGMPDVYAAENAFVKRFVNMEGGYRSLDFNDVGDVTQNIVPYVAEIGTNENGDLKALSHQSCAGAVGYKREMAKEYLGTDDPEKIAEMLATPEKIIETARTVKEKSGGVAKLWVGTEDLFKIYLGSRDQAWVVDGKLTIDPKMNEFIGLAKTLREEGLEGGIRQWTPAWSAAVQDEVHMCYAVPTWGVPWIIDTNEAKGVKVMEADDGTGGGEGGRWGLATPIAWYEGGTWFGISEQSKNPELAWEFVKFLTTNEEFLTSLAEETGDFVSNVNVIEKLKKDDSFVNKVVNQNTYQVYGDMAAEIDGSIVTRYDDTCKVKFLDALNAYLEGNYSSEEEMIQAFKDNIANDLAGEVEVE